MSGILLVRQGGPTLSRTVTEILLACGSGFDSNPDIILNSAHRLGDGSDHADVADNTTHRGRSDNPHAVTAAQVGADPAGSAAAVQGNLNVHVADLANPHAVTSGQVAEDVYDNGAITVDTVLDWANGPVQSVFMGAIANLSYTNWAALGQTDDGKAQKGKLIIVDGDLFAPTFDDVNQGPLPTYVAGFANVQEVESLGPDGAIYSMVQWSNNQHVLLGANIFVAPTITAPWIDEGGGVYSIDGSQAGTTDLFILGTAETGTEWLVEFEMVDFNAGILSCIASGATGTPTQTVGEKSIIIPTAGAGAKYGLRADLNFSGRVRLVTERKLH